MPLAQLDIAIRAGAVATILLLAWLLLTHRREIGLPALLFAPLALCLAGFVLGNTPDATLRPAGIVGSVAHVTSGFAVVFLWWFCLSCFDRRFTIRSGVLAIGLIWTVTAALDRGLLGGSFADRDLSFLLIPLGFTIVGHLVWRLIDEHRGDLLERRRDARIMVSVFLGGMLFVDLTADALFGTAWHPHAFAMMQNAMILGFGLWLAGRLLSVRTDILTFGATKAEPGAAVAPSRRDCRQDTALHRRLSELMTAERAFLDPELTFAAFARRMGASERTVRTLINHDLGHDHFRAFLNQYRVAEARRLLADGDRADKLVAVALDSGFASLASFNRAFRAVEGCSPSAYRAAARAGVPNGATLCDAGI